MNAAQLKGMRLVYDEFHGSELLGCMVAVRTAKEMALVPHKLLCGAELADEPNGNRWGWSPRLNLWVRYE